MNPIIDLSLEWNDIYTAAVNSQSYFETKRGGRKQTANTIPATLCGMAGEAAVEKWINIPEYKSTWRDWLTTVPAFGIPDGYLLSRQVEIKSISKAHHPRGQVLCEHLDKYNPDTLMIFVYVNLDTREAEIYCMADAEAIRKANVLQKNIQREPKWCYSAMGVNKLP